jgi:hypothetical protein
VILRILAAAGTTAETVVIFAHSYLPPSQH